jgi:hypothetical protein
MLATKGAEITEGCPALLLISVQPRPYLDGQKVLALALAIGDHVDVRRSVLTFWIKMHDL